MSKHRMENTSEILETWKILRALYLVLCLLFQNVKLVKRKIDYILIVKF